MSQYALAKIIETIPEDETSTTTTTTSTTSTTTTTSMENHNRNMNEEAEIISDNYFSSEDDEIYDLEGYFYELNKEDKETSTAKTESYINKVSPKDDQKKENEWNQKDTTTRKEYDVTYKEKQEDENNDKDEKKRKDRNNKRDENKKKEVDKKKDKNKKKEEDKMEVGSSNGESPKGYTTIGPYDYGNHQWHDSWLGFWQRANSQFKR